MTARMSAMKLKRARERAEGLQVVMTSVESRSAVIIPTMVELPENMLQYFALIDHRIKEPGGRR